MTEQKQELILANELRIENYLFDDTDRYFQVEQIKGTLVESKGGYMYDLGYCNGIPLTEEILLKCGFKFKETDKSNVYDLGNFRINFVNKGRFKGKKYLVMFNTISFEDFGHIKYLHQFQNLYFALTNQELDIEL